jgi:hypothetical protein
MQHPLEITQLLQDWSQGQTDEAAGVILKEDSFSFK